MSTSKTRHQFYLPDHLSARLDAQAAQPNGSKTDILTQALTAWFERCEDEQAKESFGTKLQRQVGCVERIERQLDYLTEVVGLLLRHQLTLNAHLPAFDAETRRLGQVRYEALVERAGELAARRTGNNRGRFSRRPAHE